MERKKKKFKFHEATAFCNQKRNSQNEVKNYLVGKKDKISPKKLEHISGCEICIKALVQLGNEMDYTGDEVYFKKFLTLKGELWNLQSPNDKQLSKLLWNKKAAGMSYEDLQKFDKNLQRSIKELLEEEVLD